jgi:hypothetical protein
VPQSLLLQARGLYTFPNTLSEVPQGALTTADNTVIDANGIIESRRGNQQYGTTFGLDTDIASQLMTYKKTLLMQYNDTIQYDSDGNGTWAAFSGSYPPAQVGLRTKYAEANGNFYFTSANGIECISAATASQFTTAADYIRQAGGIQALDVSGVLTYSSGGWFIYPTSSPGQSKVAYRVTWGFYDANTDFVEGVPSSRLVLTNYSSTDSANVVLTFQIPAQILDLAPNNTQFFYTIYRTAVVQTSIGITLESLDPGDEEYQVIQAYPTTAQLLAGVVTVTDNVPESFRANGALLYTNPVSGEGILQSNYPPPFALDITLYQQTMFYANTISLQQYNTALLSTENLTSGVSTITIGGQTYTFVGTPEIQNFTFDTQANTTDGGYFLLNSAGNVRQYFVWFNKSGLPEIQTITFDPTIMPVAGSYFLINSANNTDLYFVWFDPTGTTTAPTGSDTANRTGIRVSTIGLTTGTQIAAAVSAILPTNDFIAVASSNTITVTNTANGVTTAAAQGLYPVSGAFGVVVNQAGVDSTAAPTNPDTVGRVGIEVDISPATIGSGASAAAVAQAVVLAINANSDFNVPPATSVGAVVTITNSDNGVTTAAQDGYTLTVTGGALVESDGFTIHIPNHGLNNEQQIEYTTTGTPIGGLTNTDKYYVIFIDDNDFQLSLTSGGGPIALTYPDISSGPQNFSVGVGGDFAITVLQSGTGLSGNFYTFTTNAVNASTGDIYSNNSQTFTVLSTVYSDTNPTQLLYMAGTGTPLTAPGTLTFVSGASTSAATISYSVFTYTTNEVLLGNNISPAISIDETARSLITAINSNPNSPVYAFYESGPTSLPGLILLQAKNVSTPAFTLTANNILATANAGSLVNTGTSTITMAPGLTTGEQVLYISSGTDIGGLTTGSLYYVINASGDSFQLSLTSGGPAITLTSQGTGVISFLSLTDMTVGNEFSPALPTSGNTQISTNNQQINAIFYSKYQQPEAVPLVNYFLVGPKDKAILRILPIRTGLMIFKEDGIYQLTGTNGQFVINPFDSSALILAPDSAQVLNNQVYMFSTQGVVAVSDTGVSVISRPIENTLQQIITPAYNYIPNTFGVAYESDRAYLLWTVTNTNDTVPTQCFRYNVFTTAWTRWPISKNCGVVLINQNILYLGPCDENFIEQERKNVNRTDYADRMFELDIPANSITNSTTLTLSSNADVVSGDALVQTQNLTISEYNQMLQKLDLDPGPALAGQYYSTLGALPGIDLFAAVNNLASLLDTDNKLNPTYPTPYFVPLMVNPDTFIGMQANFNVLVTQLNSNANISYRNFPSSSGTEMFETLVTAVINNSNNVIISYEVPFIVGPIQAYQGINCNVTWTPQTFGDPSISKHVSEGTFLFQNTSFYSASVSYASDLSQNFESVSFLEEGIGDWGFFVWDDQNWGGTGTQVPLRTYIPRYKQYCRFIIPNFNHINAREIFALYGTSLTFRPLSERAYRN